MLLRYGTSRSGAFEKKAHVYTPEEHGIDAHRIDADAVRICQHLRREGFHAYVVGGAVRDLLVGRAPKDFDIATDARPQQIRRMFRSARLIGRRFRIVHIYVNRLKYLEVTTFRSERREGSENWFGTMEEDARRRDFTINALYYEPFEEHLVDYVGGLDDVRGRRLRTLMPAEESFTEDPVRMIRAVKYASYTGFPIPMGMALLLRRLRRLLLTCSRERVTEEVYKILCSGNAADILERAYHHRMLEVLLPAVESQLRSAGLRRLAGSPLARRLAELDERARAGEPLEREAMFSVLLRDVALERRADFAGPEPELAVMQYLRTAAEPLFPSRRDLQRAAADLLEEIGTERQPRRRHRRRRGGRHARRPPGGQPHRPQEPEARPPQPNPTGRPPSA